ncbi:hypothetical protein [Lentzea sp. NPDC060358]|uniref:hypothetical protein n=1 Tax=Lentzea sp. NPDC060358 TaxID=3347103 RepID=UPI00364FDEED
MIGPDQRGDNGAWTRNHVDENLGNTIQTGEARGDVNVGTSTYHSRTTTISLPAAGVIIGVVLTVVIGLVVWKVVATGDTPTAAPTPRPTDTAAQADATTPPTTSTPARTSAPAREIRLSAKTGVDVDGDDFTAKRADGANGKTDLYLNEYNLLYANGSNFADDRGPEQQAHERCTEAIANGDNTATTVLPALTGSQYCFVTSDGRVGWLRIKTTTLSSFDSSSSVVFAVRTWPR